MGSTPLDAKWSDYLTGDEVDRVLELRDRGIKKGVLRARPNLAIEHDFRMPVADDEMHGVIDVMDRAGVVEDHKAVFAERYAKTEADLLGDIPMMIYGGYLFSQEPALTEVTLRHNQFMQDTLAVRPVEVKVSRANCRGFWAARVMPLLATMNKHATVEQWADVPGQPRLSKACTNYGGCPFNLICHGGQSIEAFKGGAAETNGAPF
jgi:hypothetical protein